VFARQISDKWQREGSGTKEGILILAQFQSPILWIAPNNWSFTIHITSTVFLSQLFL